MPETAKEMFKKLGYEYDDSDEYNIKYKKYFPEVECFFIMSFNSTNRKCEVGFEGKREDLIRTVDICELKAIAQQMKELGWDK